MKVKPPYYILSLLWGLILLTSSKTAIAEANVSNAVAATPVQHVRVRTPSTAKKDHDSVEERVFPSAAADQVIRNELQPFAGKLISKDVIDLFHKKTFKFNAIQQLSNMRDVNAINALTRISGKNYNHLVIWFGTKSPEEQEVVLDLLVAQLKSNSVSRLKLLQFLEAGKASASDEFRIIAAAVEKKWLMSISTDEMYNALELPYIWDDEEFVRDVGHSIWEKFQSIGEEEFTAFMLTKMRERSEDEIMWARLIYKMENDETVKIPLAGMFDELIQTKAVAAGYCRPIVAVKILMSPRLLRLYHGPAGTSEHIGAVVVDELFKWSKDELMWAKLIYILQNDKSVPTIPSSVFDHLLQPYETFISEEARFAPSQAVKYLTSPEFSRIDDRLFTGNKVDAKLLAKLLEKSHDELMWAKVLHMLKNDKSVSAPVSGVLTALLHSWTEWPNSAAAIAEQTPFSMSKEILINPKFYYLYMYAHFASDNPDVFLLEKLRERSTDEIVWAQALNALGEDQSVHTPLSGVLDALLHSWIEEPYNTAALADNQPALIGAYKLLLKYAVVIHNTHKLASPQEAEVLVNVLLKWSNDKLMWAKFLHKLQQDQAFSVAASSAFDALLQSNDATQTAHHFLPSLMVEYLRSPRFFRLHNYFQSGGNPEIMLLSHLFTAQSPDQVMWAKVLYIMQNDESEAKTLYSSMLDYLLVYWTYDVTGIAISPNLYIESKSYLESHSFANLIAYAHFSSDDPDTFVLQKLRERSANDFMWARLLNILRKNYPKPREEGDQVREEEDALSGVLNALFHSWIGKPYDAAAASDQKRALIAAYDYLTSKQTADWYNKMSTSEKTQAHKVMLIKLLNYSKDDVMWAKFLSKLQKDRTVSFSLFGVYQTLLESWVV